MIEHLSVLKQHVSKYVILSYLIQSDSITELLFLAFSLFSVGS